MKAPSPERWAAIQPVLDSALDLVAERRSAFLAERCATDPELRREVERVLDAVDSLGSFLEDSASVFASPLVARLARQEVLSPGDQLGVYRIERDIGRGGMATVYLAHDSRHDRLVALKVLDRDFSSTLGADRFVRETAIAARLNHPHILPLFDSGVVETAAGSALYYAMPFVDGRSLRDRLREQPRLPVDAAVAIARQVAEALDHAHQHGVIHRDIKPENVLLAGDHAFVADFGIALALDAAGDERLTRTGLSLGTPAYMSPEQATTGRVDGRSDLYSLGCMLYEMLAGQPPFSGSTARTVLTRHMVLAAPPLRAVRPEVSPALGRVIARSLAKAPDDRFPNGRAFAEGLSASAAMTPTRVDTACSFAVSAVYAIRRRRMLAAVVTGGLVVTAAAAMAAHRVRPATPALDRAIVAVAPYRVSAADTALRYLGEGMVDLLASRLGGTEALRPVESRVLLPVWRGTRGAGGDLTPSQTQALAARLGAGRVVVGEIVGSGSRITISSRMLDVASLRILARQTMESSMDSLPTLLDRLAGRLLAIAADQPAYRLASLTATPLPALRAYLNGEALDRQGFGDSAAQSFEEAIRTDSTFALAAMHLLHANTWGEDHGAKNIAWKYRDRLSVEDRADLTVTLGPRYPAPSRYREQVAAGEHFVEIAPTDPLSWYELGIGLFEDGPLYGLSEAHARAEAAFARAVALDSANVPALARLSVAATVLGDTATARRALELLRRQRQDTTSQIDFEPAWFLAAMTGDTGALHRVLRRDSLSPAWATARPDEHAWAMMRLGLQEGLDLRDADGVLDRAVAAAATLGQRAGIRWNQAVLDGIRGRSDTSGNRYPWGSSGLSILPRSKDTAGPILNFLFTDLDSTGWDRSGTALLRQLGSQRSDQCCLTRFAAGQYALATNRLDLAARAAADLRRYRGPSPDMDADTIRGSEMSRELATALEAQIAARRHDPSAAERLRQLDSVLADPFEDLAPLLGNLVAAQLHEERGEIAEARAALSRRWWGAWVDPGYVVYHREEGRLAALAGDTAAAVRAYHRYLALRGEAEPRLQPWVQRVRSSLAALER